MKLLGYGLVLGWGQREKHRSVPVWPALGGVTLPHRGSTKEGSNKSASGEAKTSWKWQEATSCELSKLANEEDVEKGRVAFFLYIYTARRQDVLRNWADLLIVTSSWGHYRLREGTELSLLLLLTLLDKYNNCYSHTDRTTIIPLLDFQNKETM